MNRDENRADNDWGTLTTSVSFSKDGNNHGFSVVSATTAVAGDGTNNDINFQFKYTIPEGYEAKGVEVTYCTFNGTKHGYVNSSLVAAGGSAAIKFEASFAGICPDIHPTGAGNGVGMERYYSRCQSDER